MRRTGGYVFLGVLIILISLILFLKNIVDRNLKSEKEDPKRETQNIPQLYLNSFSNIRAWSFKESVESKFRYPISEFKINNAQLFVYNIGNFTLPIDKLINQYFVDNHVTFGYTFNVLTENDRVDILYKSEPARKGTAIFFNIYGDNTQRLIKNDTVLYYYSNFKTFSIGYEGSCIQDFFGKVKDQYMYKKPPLEILFFKKNNDLYLLLMTIDKKDAQLPPFELYDAVFKK